MVYAEVTWIFVVATVVAVFVAYGIGANDLANSFGTSVGAGALSMRQALAIAALCEFGGAVLMGSGVTETIRDQVADLSYFENKPDIYAYGMLAAMFSAGIWLILATYWELPVSSTHTVVGAVVGMTMVAAGPDAVNWSERTDSFPFIGGVTSILLSWVFSPLLTGGLSLVLFAVLRSAVLRSPRAYHRAYYVLPLFVYATTFVISMFIIQQGGSRFEWDHTPLGTAAWISAIVGAGCAVVAVTVQWFVIRQRVERDLKLEIEQEAARVAAAAALQVPDVEQPGSDPGMQLEGMHDELISDVLGGQDPLSFGFSAKSDASLSLEMTNTVGSGPYAAAGLAGRSALGLGPAGAAGPARDPTLVSRTSSGETSGLPGQPRRSHRSAAGHSQQQQQQQQQHGMATPAVLKEFRNSAVWSTLTHGVNYDVHQVVDTDERIAAIHYHSERFDWKAEGVFKYLQVFTAMANSFAHGSNDISNSVGPYAAIYFVWLHSSINMEESQVPVWILAIGGVGLVLGLLTYGYKIMRILGVKVTRLTHSRGFIVEISGAVVVMLCSRYGLPISTTHCLVGAVVGIGLLEGRQGLNWRLLLRFFTGWVATLVVAALTAAAFTAQGIYSPNNSTAARRYQIDVYLQNTTAAISGLLESTGVPAYTAASAAINASQAALPNPLLDVTLAAEVQLQALQAYQAATTWVVNATTNATG